jgi:uncharacterized protein
MKYGLNDQQFAMLLDLVINPLKVTGATVWIFGSRARGDYKPFSDIDLMYELPKGLSLPTGFISQIKEKIEESRFPYKIDLVDAQDMAQSYRENAHKDKTIL